MKKYILACLVLLLPAAMIAWYFEWRPGIEADHESGPHWDEREFPELVTSEMMKNCMDRINEKPDCTCGIENYKKTHRPEDPIQYDYFYIAVATCRGDQHAYPERAVEDLVSDCLKSFGGDRDECECEIRRVQLLVKWSDFVRATVSGRPMTEVLPGEVWGEAAACIKDQHRYPKIWADAIVRGCLRNGDTPTGCKCLLEGLQRVWRYEDSVSFAVHPDNPPPQVVAAVRRCLSGGWYHYPPLYSGGAD
jgi:hypothetical protein